jgi:hypothetical protein
MPCSCSAPSVSGARPSCSPCVPPNHRAYIPTCMHVPVASVLLLACLACLKALPHARHGKPNGDLCALLACLPCILHGSVPHAPKCHDPCFTCLLTKGWPRIAAASIARLSLSTVGRAASFTILSLLVCPSWTHSRPLLLLIGRSATDVGFGLLPLVQHTRAHHAVICQEFAGLPLAAPRLSDRPGGPGCCLGRPAAAPHCPSGKGLRPARARYRCSHGLTPCGRPNLRPRQPLEPRCPSASRP